MAARSRANQLVTAENPDGHVTCYTQECVRAWYILGLCSAIRK